MRFEQKGTRPPPSFFNRAIQSTRVSFKMNRLRAVEVEEIETKAARALARGRLGHASSTDHEATPQQLIARALAASQHGRPVRMLFPASRVRSRSIGASLMRLSAKDVTAVGQEILASIQRIDKSVSVELAVQRRREEIRLSNSAGGRAEAVSGELYGEVWVERHRDDDVLVIFDSFRTAQLDNEHCRLADRVVQRLAWADKLVQIQAGRMPIILSLAACASLLQPLVLGLSGARARSKSSPLAGKLGQQLFDSRLTLIDDGTLPGRPGGTFDHEAVPRQRTVLIHNGVVKNFYYDLRSAAQLDAVSTGNGRRELLAPPHPQPSNVIVQPGTTSLDAMLRQAGNGLLVDLLLGANPVTELRGTFSRTVLLGFKIEQGQIAGYVKGVALAGSIYDMLRNIHAIGDTGHWSGDMCTPYLLVGGLSVSV